MAVDFQAGILEAMENVRTYQANAIAVQQELLAATVSVRAKDRSVTVKMGAQGDIRSITFHSNAHQSMPSAELGALLTELINRGRGMAQERAMKAMASLGDLGKLISGQVPEGKGDLGELMTALRGVTEPEAAPSSQARQKKQEEFHG